MSLLFVDADHFKGYNDNYGPAGDVALQMIADCLKRRTRLGVDIVARYGGQEFVIVLPGAGLSEAVGIGESIRECVQDSSQGGEQSGVHPLTVSVGCSTITQSNGVTTATGLLAAARAVYVAKELEVRRIEHRRTAACAAGLPRLNGRRISHVHGGQVAYRLGIVGSATGGGQTPDQWGFEHSYALLGGAATNHFAHEPAGSKNYTEDGQYRCSPQRHPLSATKSLSEASADTSQQLRR